MPPIVGLAQRPRPSTLSTSTLGSVAALAESLVRPRAPTSRRMLPQARAAELSYSYVARNCRIVGTAAAIALGMVIATCSGRAGCSLAAFLAADAARYAPATMHEC